MANIFIAPKLKIGFQNRSDCFTGKLAYIIYYDEKGKIRKEKSWESWRDKKITPEEYGNDPMEGFTINKDIKRYSGDWFSSHRTMVRIHDPRGFEFEITTENLIAILMHTDCSRRSLIGQFVYAWSGTDLILLPTNSQEYQDGIKHTVGLSKKVSVKDLVPGISYKQKRDKQKRDVIYLGKFNWYQYNQQRYSIQGLRSERKVHVFTYPEGKKFFFKDSMEFLSEASSDTPVSNYGDLVDTFNKQIYAKKIVKWEMRRVAFDSRLTGDQHWPSLVVTKYFQKTPDGSFREYSPSVEGQRKSMNGVYVDGYDIRGYRDIDHHTGSYNQLNTTTGEITYVENTRQSSSGYYANYHSSRFLASLEQMEQKELYFLSVTFEDGTKKQIKDLHSLYISKY